MRELARDDASPRVVARLVRVALTVVFALSAVLADAWAHNPECSAILAGAGPGTKLQSNGVDVFGVRGTVTPYNPRRRYTRADVTLGSSWHSTNYAQTLVLWGSTVDSGAGGWRAWINKDYLKADAVQWNGSR